MDNAKSFIDSFEAMTAEIGEKDDEVRYFPTVKAYETFAQAAIPEVAG